MEKLLQIKSLGKSYQSNRVEKTIFNSINFDLFDREIISVIGPSDISFKYSEAREAFVELLKEKNLLMKLNQKFLTCNKKIFFSHGKMYLKIPY